MGFGGVLRKSFHFLCFFLKEGEGLGHFDEGKGTFGVFWGKL